MSRATVYRLLLAGNLVVMGLVVSYGVDPAVVLWVAASLAFSAYAVGRTSGERHGRQTAAATPDTPRRGRGRASGG